MLRLIGFLVVLAALVFGLGYWRGWFHVATETTPDGSHVTVTVDKDKLREDKNEVKDKVENLEDKTKAKLP